jgi:hypothetical protein
MHDFTGLVEKVNDLSVDGIFANDNKILKLSLPILIDPHRFFQYRPMN